MKILKSKKWICLLLILVIELSAFIAISSESTYIDRTDTRLKTANSNDDDVKIFSVLSATTQDCYINRDEPGLNVQPQITLQNYFLSYGRMNFENIEAINYTKNIETDPTEFIINFDTEPMYIYQKFYIEMDQYINNISVFIQDITDTFDPVYNDANSWEITIFNCVNDEYGAPNSNESEALGKLKKRHPDNIAAHWEVFDFKNDGDGPIFLNTSITYSTSENGITKYWFAYRVKIPPYDIGPKFLYYNPDGLDPQDIGEGDTFLFIKSIAIENYTYNNATTFSDPPDNGTLITGDIDSFKFLDEDRFVIEPITNNLTLDLQFNIKNHSSGYTYEEIRNLPLDELIFGVFSVDFEISLNISNEVNINEGKLYAYNYTGKDWFSLDEVTDINLTTDDESTQFIRIEEAESIQQVLHFINVTNNNSMQFRFYYNGSDSFTVAINKFTVNFGELRQLNDTVQPYDPEIRELVFPLNVIVKNGTEIESDLEALKLNDDFYYEAEAKTNNLTIELEFSILPDLNNSLWAVGSLDWIYLYPNPLIPQIELRIASNVSINSPDNLSFAALEILDAEGNWFMISETNKSFAFRDETILYAPLNSSDSWILLQTMNKSKENSVKMRVRYIGNQSQDFENFKVTIDEFTFDIHLQNVYSSDIASKIGFGLNSDTLKPEDIGMKNFGTNVNNIINENQTGYWAGNIPSGGPIQGLFEFNVSSLWHAITFDVGGTFDIYKLAIDIDFEDDIEVRYMTGTNYFSVEVLDGLEEPVEDLELTFELLDVNDKVVDEDTARTNEDGIAKGSLRFKNVGDGYKIKVSYEKAGIYGNEDIESEEFRVVDEFGLFMDNFLIWLPYILIVLAGIVLFTTVRHHRLTKLRKIWAKDALTLDDLLKISYILIIHKDAGVTLYSKQISMELDSDLIGGFLTAISEFRTELKKDVDTTMKGKGFEMDYYDSKIDIIDGEFVRVALILDGAPSEQLKANQWEFTRSFEMRFGSILGEFTGDITPFRDADKIVEKFFNITLMYPLQLAKHWEFTKVNKLERALLEVADQMQKERKFIFVSSLLSYGLAGRKATRDQIISTIIGLKRREILVPVQI